MKKLLTIAVLLSAATAQASFEDYLTGGRASAFDGAYTAVADDVFGLYYNPASPAHLKQAEVGTFYGRLYNGLSQEDSLNRSYTGISVPYKKMGFGASYSNFQVSDLYKEQAIGLTYSQRMGRLALGITGKYLNKKIDPEVESASDPVFNSGKSRHAYTMDLGLLFRATSKFSFGVAVINLTQPDVSLQGDNSDRASRTWRWGVARHWKSTNLSFDYTHSKFTDYDNRLHAGVEQWVKDFLALRLGGGVGNRDYQRITGGVGVRVSNLSLDYGFMLPFETVKDTSGTHQASLSFKFGGKK